MDFLFDIGNVIMSFDFTRALNHLMPQGTPDADKRLEKLLGRKDEFEAGRIHADVYFLWAAEVLDYRGSHEEFIAAWVSIFTPNLPMWQSIEKLEADGHRLILFSNINNPHKDYLLGNYSIFNKFTGAVFSYQTGHVKPEPAIYQLAIDQYKLSADSTAYIDDLPANIKAGNQVGFLCHEYRADRHEDFLKWISTIS